jgi:hypothetical protein
MPRKAPTPPRIGCVAERCGTLAGPGYAERLLLLLRLWLRRRAGRICRSGMFNRQIDYMILTILLWMDGCPASAARLRIIVHACHDNRVWGR